MLDKKVWKEMLTCEGWEKRKGILIKEGEEGKKGKTIEGKGRKDRIVKLKGKGVSSNGNIKCVRQR
jgi:hypothetical protein